MPKNKSLILLITIPYFQEEMYKGSEFLGLLLCLYLT